MKSSRCSKKLQYAFLNISSHSVVPLAHTSLFFISINVVASRNMKTHWNKKTRFDSSKQGYCKCLVYGMKKYMEWFYDYCKNTNLHGFRYINIDESSIVEKVFWLVVCLLSIMFCVLLMMRLWANYSKNPIITSIYPSNPIWDIPFPAVTICNNNKVYRPQADLIAKYLYTNGFTADDSDKFFSSLMKLIRPNKISLDNVTARELLDNLGVTVEALMEQLMQPCSALLLRCAWVGKIYDCGKIFKTIKSKEGFCCAFNSHYDVNSDYTKKKKQEIFGTSSMQAHSTFRRIILRIFLSLSRRSIDSTDFNVTSDSLPGVHKILNAPGSGRDVGLAVALNIEPDMYKATTRPYVGASIMIHDPIDFPDIGAHIASVPPGHVLTISVAGTFIKSMESLRGIPQEKRSCYFDNEILGETHYSYQSCISECIAERTYNLCGCLPFYYPETNKRGRTCYLPDINCLLRVRKLIPEYMKSSTCKCLPQCTDMMYDIFPEDIKMDDVGFDSDLTHGFNINNVSFVYVFFGDVSYIEYRKESIISWDSLLASFGGMFGLCLGGSMLSVIELVYLLARQLFSRQLRKGQEQSRAKLPPASNMFLSIPIKDKAQLQKSRNRQRSDVLVTWYQPSLQHRKITNLDDINHIKHIRF
ncbi:pickpocket protein 28 [Solenopsis invicta]|uniref:pickpocket protein 28 n=1 Tax=Solenopsis invicta TaxID=13686 RepID=UPI00193D48DA|nr:pickpocket protein 28 [Solenopsis invicta]